MKHPILPRSRFAVRCSVAPAAALLSAALLLPAPALADFSFASFTVSRGTYPNKIHLEWSATPGSTGVSEYDVARDSYWANGSLGFTYIKDLDGTQLQYDDDTNVEPGIPYKYLVIANDASWNAVRSEEVYGWAGTPAEAVDVSATQGTHADKVRITWGVPDGAQGSPSYTVRRFDRSGWIFVGTTTGRYVDDTNVVAGVRYTYRVETFDTLFKSDTAEGWVDPGTPVPTVTDLEATQGTLTDRVRLTWTAPNGASSYSVVRLRDYGGVVGFETLADSLTSPGYEDTTAVIGVHYNYRVDVIDEWGRTSHSALVEGWTLPETPVVTDLEATQGTLTDRVRLTWTAPDYAASYKVRRYRGQGYTDLAQGLTSPGYDDMAAEPGEEYRYQIFVTDEWGRTSQSDFATGWVAERPDNDDFENAWAISGESGSSTSTNICATYQAGEPFLHELEGYEFTSNTLWWAWTAPMDGVVQFNTEGSVPDWDPDDEFDTVLAVYTGSSLTSLTEVAFNDDIDTASNVASSTQFAASRGTTYRIQVAGKYSGDVGAIRLNWSYLRPDNDDFEDAWAISSKSGSSASTNIYATFQTDEPYPAGVTTANRTVWWSYAAPLDGVVQFNTDGSVDPFSPEGDGPKDGILTALAIYTGNALASLEEVCSGTPFYDSDAGIGYNWCSNAFEVASGMVYRVQASGYGEYEFDEMTQKWAEEWGLIRLNWSYTHYRVTFDPNGGTISTNAVMVPVGQKLGDAMASFPVPVLEGYRFVDWKFENNASVSASSAFAITESHHLTAEWAWISSNDDFENALPLDSPGQTSGFSEMSNTNATLQAGEPLLSAYPNATHTLWWSWTAPANGTAHFSTTNSVDEHGSQIDTVIGVYTGSALGSLGQVATGDDGVKESGFIDDIGTRWSVVDFEATEGTTYYVCVGVNDKYNQQVVEGMIRLYWSLETSGVSSGGFALLPPGSSGLDIPLALGQVTDPALGDVIGGSVSNYNDFAEWANGKGANGVRASRHAAASYLLGTTALLQNDPVITIGGMVITNDIPLPRRGSPSDVVSMTLTVSVTDGGEPVEVTAAKVAALFEATTDLSDWETPAKKLDPHAEAITSGSATTVTVRVTPGDGTAPQAFLRIRR